MIEAAALDVIAVRAIESADRERSVWSDADRAWASAAAAESVGEAAPAEVFVARRAQLALGRLGDRFRFLPRAVGALRWRPWIAYALILAAFVLGVAVDRVGNEQRINVLAPPVLLLLAWNLAVYGAIAVAAVLRRDGTGTPGPLRSALVHLAAGASSRRSRGNGPLAAALATFATDWARLAAPLHNARAARILHLAAAALALGVIAGLYLRGLALEYRATWESTFLDPATVRSILAAALAPGAWVAGIAVPDATRVAAIRAPGSENAATWLHLMASTLLVLVVLPRTALALAAGLRERHRAARLHVPLDEPYFERLLRSFRAGPAEIRVLPYAFTPTPAALAGLEAVLARFMGGTAKVAVSPPFAYGDDYHAAADAPPAHAGPVVLLFNLSATPERDVHGAFVATVAATHSPALPIVVVDETAFRARAGDDSSRLDARRALWRDLVGSPGIAPAFIGLATPDVGAAVAALDATRSSGDGR